MARLRATPRPRDFQDPRDPIKLLAQARRPAIRRATKEALQHFRKSVPIDKLTAAIRSGNRHSVEAAIPVDHFAEVLKSVFNIIGDVRFDAADIGARSINADFRRAGRRVRYVRKFDPGEERDEHGRWSGSGGLKEKAKAAQDWLKGKSAKEVVAGIAANHQLQHYATEGLIFGINSLIAHGGQMHGSFLDSHTEDFVAHTVNHFSMIAGVTAMQGRDLMRSTTSALMRRHRRDVGNLLGLGKALHPVEAGLQIALDLLDTFHKAFNSDEPRDERGRWTGGGGNGAKGTTVNVDGRQVTAELSPVAAAVGDKLVAIDTQAFDRSFARDAGFYVGRNGEGSGGVEGRYGRFQDYLSSHDSFQVSEVGVQDNGQVGFTNGRHRYAVLRDSGLRSIPVSMDAQSIANAKRYGYLRGIYKLEKAVGDEFDFDRFDEETLARLRQAQDDLIVEMTDQTRDTVAYLLDRGVQAGDSAEEIAASIRDTISLTERQAQAVANYRSLLEDLDKGALERELRNAEYDAVVQNAIDAGEFLSDSAIERMVEEYADNYLDYRAETIARTESLRAANAGLRDSYRQAADRGVFPTEAVTRHWKLGDRPCPVCMQISENSRDGVGLDEDFESDDGPVDDPPVHPSCYCTIEYVTNLDMLPDDQAAEEEDATA